MKEISVKTILHSEQRYPTCGDYFDLGDKLQICVSSMENSDYEFLVAIHEMIEWYLSQKNGITNEQIDEFDKKFEDTRETNKVDEPGNDKRAPYYLDHQAATSIEMIVALLLKVDWNDYDKTVKEL